MNPEKQQKKKPYGHTITGSGKRDETTKRLLRIKAV
jgi:hypothetical protein